MRDPRHLTGAVQTLWPTPSAADSKRAGNFGRGPGNPTLAGAVKMWPTPQARDHRVGGAERVGDPARHGGYNLNDWATRWPTPQARDWRSGATRKDYGNTRPLSERVSGKLNPMWVSVLMGFPPDWTEVE